MIQEFDFQPTIRTVFGTNSINKLKDYLIEFGKKNILIVTDPGIVKAGIVEKIHNSIKNSSFEVHIFEEVESNPTTEHVDNGVLFAKDKGIEIIVGIGGGSAMDCAKGINFLLSNGGRMEDYWGKNKAGQNMLPSIGIPTTAGTGSEAQSFALIAQKGTHKKMACGDIKARFSLVILDPDLLKSVPKQTAIITGIDALSHAIESYVSTAANAISKIFAREAWKLLNENIEKVIADQVEIESWGSMLLGAHLAGLSIENSMLGAAHAMANPVTAQMHIDHGIAVGLTLPHVIKFNAEDATDLYYGLELNNKSIANNYDNFEYLIDRIYALFDMVKIPAKLRDHGVHKNDLNRFASEAVDNWTSYFNPKPLTKQDFLNLYEHAF